MLKNNVRLRIFLTAWLVYILFIYIKPESISANLVDLAMSVVDHGDVYMRYGAGSVDGSVYNGHHVSGHLPGGSALLIPLYFASKPLMTGITGWSRFLAVHALSILFIASVCGALIAVLLYSFLRRIDMKEGDRLLITFLFAFGTMNFGYSTSFYNGIQATLYVFAAFFLLFRARLGETKGNAPYFWSGLLAGAGAATHLGVASICLVLFVYGAFTGGVKRIPAMLAGALLPLAALSGYMKFTFGSFLTTPYSYHISPNPNMMTYPRLRNFAGLFFGPKAGFFVYMPVMLLPLWGITEAFRKRRYRAEAAVITCILLVTGIISAGYVRRADPYRVAWPHEAHMAVRYLLPVCPFLMIATAFMIDRVKKGLVYVLGAVSVFFAYLGAQTGLLPYGGWPVVYASKIFVSSFGMPALFCDFLPRYINAENFHTYIARPDVSLAQVLSPENRGLLEALIRNQLFFFAAWMTAAAAVALVIWWMWRGPGKVRRAGLD